MAPEPPSRRELFEQSLTGAANRPPIPHLQHDVRFSEIPIPRTLEDYRTQECPQARVDRIQALWHRLLQERPILPNDSVQQLPLLEGTSISPQRAEELRKIYFEELFIKCQSHAGPSSSRGIDQKAFRAYIDQKEEELWNIFHRELDLDGNGHLDAEELGHVLDKAGIQMSQADLSGFMSTISSVNHPHTIDFPEFRDFFLLLPRQPTPKELLRYYEVRRLMGENDPARVTVEGDVILIGHDYPAAVASYEILQGTSDIATQSGTPLPIGHAVLDPERVEEPSEEAHLGTMHETHAWYGGNAAAKFLLAGGIAGAVSRTATAPFDRLKVFLITRPPELSPTLNEATHSSHRTRAISIAIRQLFEEGGVAGFWVGNGLNVMKIFPESAIKFFSYESSKLFFAKYWDKVDDPRDIGGVSRFISGGIGGITSQLSIYPIETLKTQMMSSTGESKRTLVEASRRLWALGGARAYYRGLVIGLVGVFPYSAIDMSTFEALKLAYLRSTGEKDPGVLATLAFGSTSGAVGATAVYPLNLVRTRMQASGSSGHPQIYTGVFDVTAKTFRNEGIRGFYRGLVPSLAKVVPAVSISYVVYEDCKKRLGLA